MSLLFDFLLVPLRQMKLDEPATWLYMDLGTSHPEQIMREVPFCGQRLLSGLACSFSGCVRKPNTWENLVSAKHTFECELMAFSLIARYSRVEPFHDK